MERKFRRRKWQPTPVFLPGESPGRGSLVGCRLWGHKKKKKKKKRKFRYFISIKWLCRNNDVMNINSFQPQMCQDKFKVPTYICETHVHTCVSYYACSIKLKIFYLVTFSTINHVPSCDFSYFLDIFFYLELLLCFSGLCQQLCLYLQIFTHLPKCLHPSQCFVHSTAATAKSLQSCPTLCDPIDGSPPGSPVPGILQARTLEWVAISFSNA